MPLATRQFWRSYWIALQRSNKDRRARGVAFRITSALAYLLAYVASLYLLGKSILGAEGGGATLVFYGLFLGVVAAGVFMLRRAHRRQDDALKFSLTDTQPARQQADEVAEIVRTYFAERTVIIASLIARAGSEIYLLVNEFPPGVEVVTRQAQNAILREKGLWDKLEPAESDLVSTADGRWSEEQRQQLASWCEQLRLLRWTLGIDAELMPLIHFPKVDFALSQSLEGPREVLLRSERTLAPWELRVERDIAWRYFARIVAELKGRDLIGGDSEMEKWTAGLRAATIGPSTDYLAGPKTVGELDDESLKLLGVIAWSRGRYAAYLVDQLSADNCFSFATWSPST
jgi:hypothetical protein